MFKIYHKKKLMAPPLRSHLSIDPQVYMSNTEYKSNVIYAKNRTPNTISEIIWYCNRFNNCRIIFF